MKAENSQKLDDWLAAARADLSSRLPDTLQEHRMLSRLREAQALRSVEVTRLRPAPRIDHATFRSRTFFGWLAPVLVSALLGIALVVVMITPSSPVGAVALQTPFVALAPSDEIADTPSAVVVTSQVSGATLGDYGLPVDPARADRLIGAEFLVSPAGMLLAVRFTE
ncbi:MAG: hypothetical protein H0V16_06920 [Burkholderiaceae bacterium]|nr:hypothetical protein [Burkholderiaceae bacterium]